MRTTIFRILAGLLAIGFCFTLSQQFGKLSLRGLAAYGVITLVFALFAILGPAAADRRLALFLPGYAKHVKAPEEELES